MFGHFFNFQAVITLKQQHIHRKSVASCSSSFIKLCAVVLRLDRDKYIQNTVSWKYEYVFVLIFYFQLISPIFKTFFFVVNILVAH